MALLDRNMESNPPDGAAGVAGISEQGDSVPIQAPETAESVLSGQLQTIFRIIETNTGNDFSYYKISTIMRRIERRISAHNVPSLAEYVALLQSSPQEAQALCQDILIGVTSFFRDPEAFELIRTTVIPALIRDRSGGDPVQIWHACCASGEEVYSLAMLIREYLTEHQLDTVVQMFATDIDAAAVARAGAGLYPDRIAADVGEARLTNFFSRSGNSWQVSKELREMVVFTQHNLLKPPPFSRLDMLICRNCLIYLNPDIQKRLIGTFHQVLKPGGILFLGSAESVGHNSSHFATINKKWKLFSRKEGDAGAGGILTMCGRRAATT